MNEHEMKGNWKQFKGKVRRQWGKLTDDDIDRIEGNREILIGRLQERYGKRKGEVEREVDEWFDSLAERPAAR